ncbi:MAG TPA: hypothetical protein VIY09_07665 [Rhizomicrobium sp.]
MSEGLEARIHPENTRRGGWSGRRSAIWMKAVVSGGSLGGVE